MLSAIRYHGCLCSSPEVSCAVEYQASACTPFSYRRSSRSLSLQGLAAWTFGGIATFMWHVWCTLATSLMQVTTRLC